MIEHPCPFYFLVGSLLAQALRRGAREGASPEWANFALMSRETGTTTVPNFAQTAFPEVRVVPDCYRGPGNA